MWRAYARRWRLSPARAADPRIPERVFDALHGNLSAEERRAVVDELVLNADAAEAWRLARELAPDPAPVAAPAGRSTGGGCRLRRRQCWWWD